MLWSLLVVSWVRAATAVATACVAAPGFVTVEVAPTAVRSECFVVQRAVPPVAGRLSGASGSFEPVAVVRLLRLDAADHTLLEREIVFRSEGWRMHHTERLAGGTRRLAWREQGPTGTHTWTADWDLTAPTGGTEARVVAHGWRRPTHERLVGDAPWIGALEWLEAARAGAAPLLGEVAWLVPSRAPAPRAVRRHLALPVGAPCAFGPEGRLTVLDGVLAGFDLGGADCMATSTTETEFRRLAQRWGCRDIGQHPAVTAALSRDETLRQMAQWSDRGVLLRW